jgi:hypothetical protein
MSVGALPRSGEFAVSILPFLQPLANRDSATDDRLYESNCILCCQGAIMKEDVGA